MPHLCGIFLYIFKICSLQYYFEINSKIWGLYRISMTTFSLPFFLVNVTAMSSCITCGSCNFLNSELDFFDLCGDYPRHCISSKVTLDAFQNLYCMFVCFFASCFILKVLSSLVLLTDLAFPICSLLPP